MSHHVMSHQMSNQTSHSPRFQEGTPTSMKAIQEMTNPTGSNHYQTGNQNEKKKKKT